VLIGIDIGGTHTRFALADSLTGDYVASATQVVLPTASWRHGSLFSDQANANRLINHIPGYQHGWQQAPLAAGVHGCDSDQQCQTLASWLAAAHQGPVVVVNDSELFGPAIGLPQALNVVLGTGSIVLGRNSAGQMVKVGGHGWLLGDPGSAPGLVRESVKAIAKAFDAGAPAGLLARALMAHFASADPIDLVGAFTADAEITHWGALCPLVFEAAAAGDQLAHGVIEQAAAELAQNINQVKQQGAVGTDVVVGGGVVRAQPHLAQRIGTELAALGSDLSVTILEKEPVRGALALAANLAPTTSTKTN